MQLPPLVLAPRLVPRPLWGRSGAQLLEQDVWRAIRAEVVAEADSSCAVCGHRQQSWMVCDEDWRYAVLTPTDGSALRRGRAILVGLRLLCPPCDQVVHIGHTETRYGKATAASALSHGAKVNGVSVADMRVLAEVMFEAWASVSSIGSWTVEVEPALRQRFPALAIVENPRPGSSDV